ncbi:DegT/DnrJ/EryC1/StrS family aminotransferase [Acinetobacter sp. ANC 4639]
MSTEIPPTNGLPILFRDLLSFGHKYDLASSIANLLQIPTPALTCSGTVALMVALKTLQSIHPKKNQVIIPAWTCPLVPLAIEKLGLTPIVCDLKKDHFDFDLNELALKTNANTLAIIATHIAGLVCDLAGIQHIADQHQTYVIEDAAQAMGAQYHHQSVGLFGDIGFFSLAFGKGLTSAEGGILFSKNPELQQKLHAACQDLPVLKDWELKRMIELVGYTFLYRPSTLSLIYGNSLRRALKNNDEITAVGDDFDQDDIPVHRLGQWRSQVAASAISRLPEHWQKAQHQARSRIKRLKQLPHLQVFEEQTDSRSNFPFILLLTDRPELAQAILAKLWTQGLGVTKLFVRAIHQYPNLAHLNTPLPQAESFAQRCLSISNSAWLNDDEFEKIYNIIENTIHSYKK